MSIVLTLILIVAVIVAGLVWFAANTARKVEAAVPPCGQFMEIDGQRLLQPQRAHEFCQRIGLGTELRRRIVGAHRIAGAGPVDRNDPELA